MAEGGAPRRLEAPDSWTRARRELVRRPAVRLALLVLALLYAAAIYAPLVASDRPYWIEALDAGEYERARKALVPVALSLEALVQGGEEAFLARRLAGSTQSFREALAAERHALELRAEVLARHLPETVGRELDGLLARAADAVRRAQEGRHGEAAGAAEELVERARELRERLAPERVELVPAHSFPLLASLGAGEVFFMLLAPLALLSPLARRLVRGRGARLAGSLALASVLALAWKLGVERGNPFHTAAFKAGLTSGEIRAARVLFPPVAYGFAEQHPEESLRPPTWTAAAELSESGRYVRGTRVSRPDVTGLEPPAVPVEIRAGEPALNSPFRHVLGTDSSGRDLCARVVHGGRVSLAVGLVATAILMTIGVAVGSLAGFCGGRVDLLLSRAIEVVVSFPLLFLILVVVAFVGPSIWTVMAVIGCVGWTSVARLARAEFLRLRELDFVLAARALGFSWPRIVLRHALPNALPPLLVASTFSIASAILIESALSFLGFGVRAPIPSWGALANESREASYWWIQVFPGALVFVTVLCFNRLGDAVRDVMDPKG